MRAGERVRWYVIGLGNEADNHTPHWHGNTVLKEGRREDAMSLLPAEQIQVDMVADKPGSGCCTATSTATSMPA